MYPIKKVFVFVFCIHSFLFSQKENYHFYFGADGIEFTTGTVSKVARTAMGTHEGSAAISDNCTGELLFYTNGITVWDKNHLPMPNGTGLLGCLGAGSFPSSTTQSAIIVPLPGNKNIYYVFTNDCQENQHAGGFRYSIVNMLLNGGLGDVTVKNVLLFAPSNEKVTAVHHSNKTDIWVITHENGNANFRSYLLSAVGLSAPVISTIGTAVPTTPGYLKTSSNGQLLAMAHYKEDFSELFEFDNSTGRVTNKLATFDQGYYGVSFSPDGSKLYMCNYNIHQYDMAVKNQAAILASKVDVTMGRNTGSFFSIQQGPDKKIYCNGNLNLHVINNPNLSGLACNVQKKILPLKGFFYMGITNFVESFFDSTMFIPRGGLPSTFISSEGICVDSNILFSFLPNPAIKTDSVRWNFTASDGSTYFSSQTNAGYRPSLTGNISTSLIRYTFCGTDTTHYNIQSIDVPSITLPDTTLCVGTELLIKFTDTASAYLWNDGWDKGNRYINQAGIYWLTVENSCGSAIDTFEVVDDDCETLLFIPNAFIPGKSSANNIFKPVGNNVVEYKLLIFNRWGELLFNSTNIEQGWDGFYKGNLCQQDVYVYKVFVTDKNGQKHEYVGHIALLQ